MHGRGLRLWDTTREQNRRQGTALRLQGAFLQHLVALHDAGVTDSSRSLHLGVPRLDHLAHLLGVLATEAATLGRICPILSLFLTLSCSWSRDPAGGDSRVDAFSALLGLSDRSETGKPKHRPFVVAVDQENLSFGRLRDRETWDRTQLLAIHEKITVPTVGGTIAKARVPQHAAAEENPRRSRPFARHHAPPFEPGGTPNGGAIAGAGSIPGPNFGPVQITVMTPRMKSSTQAAGLFLQKFSSSQ